MLKSIKLPPDRHYENRTEYEPIQFYIESLLNSQQWDLLLGYFSSAAINILSLGFATFISKGGKVRLIINNVLSQTDKEVFESINATNEDLEFDLDDFVKLKKTLSTYDKHFFECLKFLIQHNRIEFKIISPKDSDGIAHYKSGIFHDQNGDKVSFNGSCNLTAYGLLKNLEEINIDVSWDNDLSSRRIDNALKRFEDIFEERIDYINYLNVEKIKTEIVNHFDEKNIGELLISEKQLLEQKGKFLESSPKLKKFICDVEEEIEKTLFGPKFPYIEGPREYQKQAFENWKANGQKGLFAMATGTGKTITSLNCLLEIYKRKGYYKAIILVPTISLIEQWEEECLKFNFTNTYRVYSKNKEWMRDVEHLILQERFEERDNPKSYIILSTYASFVKDKVFTLLNELSKTQTLLIADEAHNMGSGQLLNRLNRISFQRRIGLSATPERQYDEKGTKELFDFFGAQDQFTYEYSMALAIEKNVLSRYYYYPHLVKLTIDEMESYKELSLKIAKYANQDGELKGRNDSILTRLLLARKRIIHKAVNKLTVFESILKSHFYERKSLKYSLIYVPEGIRTDELDDLFEDSDYLEDDIEADNLIDLYSRVVKSIDPMITVRKFTSSTIERSQILLDFANGDIDVLMSMKCLDEGVDVPRSELAIFCSSTGNPRQFIQRRGRILRKHPKKHIAIIHDLVVVPEINECDNSYNLERNLLKSELERVRNFALLSENSVDSITALDSVLEYYNLSIFNYSKDEKYNK